MMPVELMAAYMRGDRDLRGADLTRADLRGADLTGADLTGADLTGADLTFADLTGADLTGADLTGADLTLADLTGADLRGADLTGIRKDVRAVLDAAPADAGAVLAALRAGEINGAVYRDDCGRGCLIGTIAIHRGVSEYQIPGLDPTPRRAAERWFLAIRPGDTPENSQVAAITAEWITEWLAQQPATEPAEE